MHIARIWGLLLPAVRSLELHSRTRQAVPARNETRRQGQFERGLAPTYTEATEYAGYNLCSTAGSYPIATLQSQAPFYSWIDIPMVGAFTTDALGPEACSRVCALISGCTYFVAGAQGGGCCVPYSSCEARNESLPGFHLKIYAFVGSTGDPHLRNLAGERFDVNQPGDHLLLRVPKQPARPALLELRGSVRAADDAPCAFYLKAVTFAGEWLGRSQLQVRSLKGKSFQGTWPNGWPFAIRTLSTTPKWEGQWTSWENVTAGGSVENTLPGTIKVATLFRQEQADAGRVMEAQAFELQVGEQMVQERASIVVAQGSHEGLDISLAKMSMLHEPRLGGLLGTELHDRKVEYRTAECEARQTNMKLLAGSPGGSRFTASWV